MLGFPHGAVKATCCGTFGDANSQLMSFDGLQCNGTETDLNECPNTGSNICELFQVAGVVCNETDYTGESDFYFSFSVKH